MTRVAASLSSQWAWVIVLLALVPAAAPAQQQFRAPEAGTPITLEAGDRLAWDRPAREVQAHGAARLTYGPLGVEAEHLIAHHRAGGTGASGRPILQRLVAKEAVTITAPPLTVTGARGELTLAEHRAVVSGSPARFEIAGAAGEPPIRGQAGGRLSYDGPARVLHLTGGAQITRGPYALSAETVRAEFAADESAAATAGWPAPPGRLARAEARGDVALAGPQGEATGQKAVYDRGEGRLAVLGGVALRRDGSTVTGEAAVLDLASERATVTGRGDRRVRAVVQTPGAGGGEAAP